MKRLLTLAATTLAATVLAVLAVRAELHWMWVSGRDVGYEDYVSAWPGERHVGEATRRLDERLWATTSATDNPTALRTYLTRYPGGLHADEADRRIDRLEWELAKLTATAEGMDAYLAAHSDGAYAAEARTQAVALRADPWVRSVVASHDRRSAFDKLAARDAKAIGVAISHLSGPIRRIASGSEFNVVLELVMAVPRLGDLWTSDTVLDEGRTKRMAARIAQLDPALVRTWRRAMVAVQKDGVSETWVALLLARMDRLFSEDGAVIPNESERLLRRLQLVPAPVATAMRDLLNTGRVDAALRIAESDAFYLEGHLRQPEIDYALAAVAGVTKTGEQPSRELPTRKHTTARP